MAKKSLALPKFTFIREAFSELKHVVWPKPRHIAVFTGLVIVAVFIVAYFISFVDKGFLAGISALRRNINPESALTDGANQPQIQATPGQILDENGNEIKIESLLNQSDIEKAVEASIDTEVNQ